jgi:hypothetical protein
MISHRTLGCTDHNNGRNESMRGTDVLTTVAMLGRLRQLVTPDVDYSHIWRRHVKLVRATDVLDLSVRQRCEPGECVAVGRGRMNTALKRAGRGNAMVSKTMY